MKNRERIPKSEFLVGMRLMFIIPAGLRQKNCHKVKENLSHKVKTCRKKETGVRGCERKKVKGLSL